MNDLQFRSKMKSVHIIHIYIYIYCIIIYCMQYMYVHCILYCSSEKFKIVYLIPSGHHETLLKTVLPDTAPYCFAKSGPSYCFSVFFSSENCCKNCTKIQRCGFICTVVRIFFFLKFCEVLKISEIVHLCQSGILKSSYYYALKVVC